MEIKGILQEDSFAPTDESIITKERSFSQQLLITETDKDVIENYDEVIFIRIWPWR